VLGSTPWKTSKRLTKSVRASAGLRDWFVESLVVLSPWPGVAPLTSESGKKVFRIFSQWFSGVLGRIFHRIFPDLDLVKETEQFAKPPLRKAAS